jgi:glycosyltransferase involved in cell wall biosynthesis
MRVGFDARWYNDSGVGAYVAGLLRALAAANREWDLVIYEHPQNPVPSLEGHGVTKVSVRAPKYSFSEHGELRSRVREDQLDIFHSPFYPIPIALGCPVVVTIHDLIPFRFRLYPWLKQWMVKTGYRSAVRRARHIIAVSQHTADDLRGLLAVPAEQVTVIHNAVPADCFRSCGPGDELDQLKKKYGLHLPYVIASSARNWRTKNLEGALEALELARKAGADFQTVVYGPNEGLDALNAEQRWPGLNLRRTGYLEAADLAALFRHAQAFIMPSLYEGFGLPVLEAMSCGCAVVTSNAGSLAEVAGAGAQTFAPGDTAGMARAIAGLLVSPEELSRWKAASLHRAADFSWETAASRTISVYHQVQQQSSWGGTGDTQTRA